MYCPNHADTGGYSRTIDRGIADPRKPLINCMQDLILMPGSLLRSFTSITKQMLYQILISIEQTLYTRLLH